MFVYLYLYIHIVSTIFYQSSARIHYLTNHFKAELYDADLAAEIHLYKDRKKGVAGIKSAIRRLKNFFA